MWGIVTIRATIPGTILPLCHCSCQNLTVQSPRRGCSKRQKTVIQEFDFLGRLARTLESRKAAPLKREPQVVDKRKSVALVFEWGVHANARQRNLVWLALAVCIGSPVWCDLGLRAVSQRISIIQRQCRMLSHERF